MATRKFFVTKLSTDGYRPNNEKYASCLKRLMVKEFKINEGEISKQDYAKIEYEANDFAAKVKTKYVKEFKYNFERMLDKKRKWFSEIFKNPVEHLSPPKPKKGRKKKKKRGRPTQSYPQNKSGGTQQWAKASSSANDHSLEELIHASILKASEDGKKNCAYILKLLKADPEGNGTKICGLYDNPVKPVIVLTPLECLAEVLIDKITQRRYLRMRKTQKKCNAKIYVSWEEVGRAKLKCQPEDIDSTSKVGEVSVPMQNVVNHQIAKILNFPEVQEKYNQLIASGRQFKLELYGKYGADGTNTDADYQNNDAGEIFSLNVSYFGKLQCSNNFREIHNH